MRIKPYIGKMTMVFILGFGLTSSKEYLIVVSQQGSVTESYAINSDLSGDLIKLVSREQAFTHDIDHAHGYFLRVSQRHAFKFSVLPESAINNLNINIGKRYKQAVMIAIY